MTRYVAVGALMIATFALVLTLSFPALAGSYTFTTTATQDVVLERLRVKLNAEGASYATIQAMLTAILTNAATDYLRQQRAEDAETACTAYVTLSAADKTTITSLLGGKEPCQ